MEKIKEKKCSKCGEIKPFSDFCRNKRTKDGLLNYCKSCRREYARFNQNRIKNGIFPIKCKYCGYYWHTTKEEAKHCPKCNNNSKLKYCNTCKKVKNRSEFAKYRGSWDGFLHQCKSCDNSKDKIRRDKNREKRIAFERKHWIRGRNGDERVLIKGLNKRDYPEGKVCEICGKVAKMLSYHHWSDDDPSQGVWVCCACHYGCNFYDKENLRETYIKLKEKIKIEYGKN